MLHQRGKAYSQDLRERVFAASDDGERVGEVAELLRVSVAYVSKALTRRRTTGETTVRSRRGHKPAKLSPLYAAIHQHVAGRRDTTIEESRPCCARPMLAASKTSMLLSVRCSMSSNQTNVPATLARQATGQLQASVL